MSQENVEIVRGFFENFIEQEVVRGPFTHPAIEYAEDPKWPGSQAYQGPEAVQACFDRYGEFLDASTVALEDVVPGSRKEVVALVRVGGESIPSGVPFDHLWGYVCRVRDAKVSYFRAYFDPNEALEAAGLSE
jgi:ketosteroid isomerase-like protein